MQKVIKNGFAFVLPVILIGSYFEANATPAFAEKEKKACGHCHVKPEGGGKRGFRGEYYLHNKLTFKGFVEKTEAKKAGVKPNSVGKASVATKPYPKKKK